MTIIVGVGMAIPVRLAEKLLTADNVLSRLEKEGGLIEITKSLKFRVDNGGEIDLEYVKECIYVYAPKLAGATLPIERQYNGAIETAARIILNSVLCTCQRMGTGCPNCHLIEYCRQRETR